MKAVQITEFGGPEVLRHLELPDPEPAPDHTIIEVDRIGVNFADTHVTRNDYLADQELPLIPGAELCGRDGAGNRFAAIVASGAYAERVAVPDAALIPLPPEIDDDQAAALPLQGLTAYGLLRICGRLAPGETVVVQAAAGGTGSLAVQLARRHEAGRIVALASTEQKRRLARELGADVAIDSRSEDLTAAILEANAGKPVDLVLEMAGGDSFKQSLRALAPFGRLVSFGMATRERESVTNDHLMRHSRSVSGFWLVHLLTRPDLVRAGLKELFGAASSGDLKATIGAVRPLSEVADAHRELAARRTTGKILLDPRN